MRVLLLDPDWDQTAHLAAHLAGAGIEVTLVSHSPEDRYGLGRYCRHVRPRGQLNDPTYLRQLIEEHPEADAILPLSEDMMSAIWQLPESLLSRVHPATSDFQRRVLSDRRAMYQMVADSGVPIPRLMTLSSVEEIPLAGETLGYPLVMRGTQGLAGEQVRIAEDQNSAASAYQLLTERSPELPFAQQFARGQRCLIGGVFQEGRMLQWFSQTTIEARYATGPSLRVRSLRDPRLTEYAERLFAALKWNGLACAEFIRTEAGEYYFLEVNPRPWAAIQAAHVCGVPLMRSYANLLLGKAITPVDFSDGKEVTLFPQFITVRVQERKLGLWKNRKAYLQSLLHAPWRTPGLILHFARKVWWQI